MNLRVLILTLTLTIGLSVPVAVAGWSGFGSNEPSTSWDSADVMHQDANVDPLSASDKVYFNAYPVQTYGLGASSYNPNVGALDTGVRALGIMTWNAMLGVWKDCNNDGYVGIGDTAAAQYRSELLLDISICPPGDSRHNDGEWVHEYFVFAMLHPCTWASEEDRAAGSDTQCEGFAPSAYSLNLPGVIFVNNTRVWGDGGIPGESGAPGGTCSITPMPPGTTSSTGLLLRQLSCGTGITRGINNANQIVYENTTIDLGLTFDNPDQPHKDADHPLNRGIPVNLYGNPVEGQDGQSGLIEQDAENGATYTTWDCSAENSVRDPTAGPSGTGELRRVGVTDPTGLAPTTVADPLGGDDIVLTNEDGSYIAFNGTDDDGNLFTYYSPSPTVGRADGSLWDGQREFYDGAFGDCDPETAPGAATGVGAVDGPLGAGGSPGKGTLDNPTTDNSGQAVGKVTNSWRLFFSGGNLNPSGIVESAVGAFPRPAWVSNQIVLNVGPVTGGVRADLSVGEPAFYSFFAHVDQTEMSDLGFALPSVDQIYGAEQCDAGIGAGQADQNGWSCDPAAWYTSAATGGSIATGFGSTNGSGLMWEYEARVGESYQLRDVDCFDSRAAGVTPPTVNPCY